VDTAGRGGGGTREAAVGAAVRRGREGGGASEAAISELKITPKEISSNQIAGD
jgi:hypothetical protein